MPRRPQSNPTAQVLRQFYLAPEDDALLDELMRTLGVEHRVRALRWLIRTYVPVGVEALKTGAVEGESETSSRNIKP